MDKKYEVTLKKVKINNSLSEETICFSADFYIDGIFIGYASNRGHGGPTDYNARTGDSEALQLMKDANEYYKSLPRERIELGDKSINGHNVVFAYPRTLEDEIEDALDAYMQQKETKKMEKLFPNHLVWGVPGSDSYTRVKILLPIDQALSGPVTKAKLKALIDKYKKQFKEGEVFFNTNIPKELL